MAAIFSEILLKKQTNCTYVLL